MIWAELSFSMFIGRGHYNRLQWDGWVFPSQGGFCLLVFLFSNYFNTIKLENLIPTIQWRILVMRDHTELPPSPLSPEESLSLQPAWEAGHRFRHTCQPPEQGVEMLIGAIWSGLVFECLEELTPTVPDKNIGSLHITDCRRFLWPSATRGRLPKSEVFWIL